LNFFNLETGKGWVSPQTLIKLANVLEIEVFELFMPDSPQNQTEIAARFAQDMSLALSVSVDQSASLFRRTIEKVCKEYGMKEKR
jgi:hypothetical protein